MHPQPHSFLLGKLLLWLALVIVLGACTGGSQPAPPSQPPAATPPSTIPPSTPYPTVPVPAHWPTDDWVSASPQSHGLDPQAFDDLLAAVESGKVDGIPLNLHSLLVVHDGELVLEHYYGSYRRDSRHTVFSITKSVIATLTGIALERDQIASLDAPILDFFPGYSPANPDPRKADITIEHLLSMTSGIEWAESAAEFQRLYTRPDWSAAMLDRPLASTPGQTWNYCSGCVHLLSSALQEATGQDPRAYAEQVLFGPLGITNFDWETDRQGLSIGGWGLSMTPRDLAKLGLLYLQGGQWDGQQVIPNHWVQASTALHAYTGKALDYGYLWWVSPRLGGYAARGRGGQLILVLPKYNLVVVTTADQEGDEQQIELVERYLLPVLPPAAP